MFADEFQDTGVFESEGTLDQDQALLEKERLQFEQQIKELNWQIRLSESNARENKKLEENTQNKLIQLDKENWYLQQESKKLKQQISSLQTFAVENSQLDELSDCSPKCMQNLSEKGTQTTYTIKAKIQKISKKIQAFKLLCQHQEKILRQCNLASDISNKENTRLNQEVEKLRFISNSPKSPLTQRVTLEEGQCGSEISLNGPKTKRLRKLLSDQVQKPLQKKKKYKDWVGGLICLNLQLNKMDNQVPFQIDNLIQFGFDQLTQAIGYLLSQQRSNQQEIQRVEKELQLKLESHEHWLRQIPDMQSNISVCLANANDIFQMKDKVDSWSERFRVMEEKVFIVQQNVDEGVSKINEAIQYADAKIVQEINKLNEGIGQQIGQQVIDTDFQIKSVIQDQEKDVKLLRNYCDSKAQDVVMQLQSQIQELQNIIEADNSHIDETPRSQSLQPDFEASIESLNGISMYKDNEQKQQTNFDIIAVKRKVNKLIQKMTNYEKSLNYLLPRELNGQVQRRRLSQRLNELDLSNAQARQDFISEFHLKYMVLQKESEYLRQMYEQLSQPQENFAYNPQADYKSYHFRIEQIEKTIEQSQQKVDFNKVKDSIQNILSQLQQKADKKELQKLFIILQGQTKPNLSNDDQINFNGQIDEQIIQSLIESVNKAHKSIALKINRQEVEELLRKTHLQPQLIRQQSHDQENLEEVVSRLNQQHTLIQGVEKKFNELSLNFVNQLNQLENQVTQEASINMQNIMNKTNEQIQSLYQSMFKQVDNSQPINAQLVKSIVNKLQNDITQLQIQLGEQNDKIQSLFQQQESDDAPLEIDENAENTTKIKRIITALQKHEGQFRQIKSLIGKLQTDMENSNQILKRQNETGFKSNLQQLQEVHTSIEDIVQKINDGAKLNSRDMSKINELYNLIEGKLDKNQITTKVDKQDLIKAYRALTKRINNLQQSIKQNSSKLQSGQRQEDPTVIRMKLVNTECLACGQEVTQAPVKNRVYELGGQFPKSQVKFGPGFSKMLPLLSSTLLEGSQNYAQTARNSVERVLELPKVRKKTKNRRSCSIDRLPKN